MDLSSPLQSLIPTMESAVLTVLAGTESPLGQSQIHRLAPRGTRRGLAFALDRLVAHGLVVAEPSNHGHLYRLNRDHVLTPAVLGALAARQEFLRRLADATARLRPVVVSGAVFGSVARRDSGPESDVDLLLVVHDTAQADSDAWQDQVRALEAQVLGWSGNRLETITVTRAHLDELVAESEPVVASWRDDALTVAGADLRRLLTPSASRAGRAPTGS
jgi:predicted nucleotidyltransferase